MGDNTLVFADEAEIDTATLSDPWEILIVDDEEGVHSVTKLALDGVVIHERKLSFTSVYSAKEAKELLARREDFCLVFLDVVMEHDQAGLEVVEYIRKELKNFMMRVIIRTGEPGSAPERMIIDNYDINDYKEKTELNVTKLYTSVRSSLLQYEQISDLYAYQNNLQSILEKKLQELQVQESALFESNKQAQMGELLSMIAHQWRQPLSRIGAVIGQMQMGLSLENLTPQAMQELLVSAEDYVQNLSKIIKDFQSLYAPSTHKSYQAIDFMIDNTILVLDESLKDKGIKVSVDLSQLDGIPELNVELKQVFMNIIKNAYDEIVKKRKENGTIEVRAYHERGNLFIEIEDNAGLGLELDENIFDAYVSDATAKHGKGLGLYICRIIVEKKCEGTISVKEGKNGACFTLTLPKSDEMQLKT